MVISGEGSNSDLAVGAHQNYLIAFVHRLTAFVVCLSAVLAAKRLRAAATLKRKEVFLATELKGTESPEVREFHGFC